MKSMLAAAQDKAISANKKRIKMRNSHLCKMCKKADETNSHIVSMSNKLTHLSEESMIE